MKTTHESPVVVRAATQKEFDALTAMGDRLDKCQKSLTDYLDTKRNAFSRFYFISDDELLSVLGSTAAPPRPRKAASFGIPTST